MHGHACPLLFLPFCMRQRRILGIIASVSLSSLLPRSVPSLFTFAVRCQHAGHMSRLFWSASPPHVHARQSSASRWAPATPALASGPRWFTAPFFRRALNSPGADRFFWVRRKTGPRPGQGSSRRDNGRNGPLGCYTRLSNARLQVPTTQFPRHKPTRD